MQFLNDWFLNGVAVAKRKLISLRARTFLPIISAWLLPGILLVLAGCVVKRATYDVPNYPLPEQFKNAASEVAAVSLASESAGLARASAAASAVIASQIVASPVVASSSSDAGFTAWWRSFGSRELAELIDRGLANNPDVKMATLRVAQAKIRADQAGAGKLPTLGATASVGRGASANDVPSALGGGSSPPQTSYQAALTGSWRPDLWGENSSLAESANFQLWQAAFEGDNVQRNVAANIASNYVEYCSLNDRLKVARETEKVLSNMLAAMERRVAEGDATLRDLEQLRAANFAARALIPSLEQQREDASNAIAFLVGTVPSALHLSDADLDSFQVPSVVPGLPSSLLLRRPDVRMIEARMLASDADIDVARARVLPPVDLSAQAGYSSLFLSQLFQPRFLFWNTVASLSANIFDGGRRAGDVKQSKIVHEEMVENYVRTIHQAMREVESALATIRLAGKRLGFQEDAAGAARRAWDISTEIYAAGGVDFMTLMDSERTYHRYLDEYQRIQADHYRGYISLFQALGGGVKVAEPLPGKGQRPSVGKSNLGHVARPQARAASAAPAVASAPARTFYIDGVDWVPGIGGGMQIEQFWQVELSGLYHRQTIGAVWRDLRVRYPQEMQNRILRPRLEGQKEDGADGQLSLYRLYVAKFATAGSATDFCRLLQTNQQRCRVVSSRSDETVLPTLAEVKPAASKASIVASAASTVAQAPVLAASSVSVSTPALRTASSISASAPALRTASSVSASAPTLLTASSVSASTPTLRMASAPVAAMITTTPTAAPRGASTVASAPAAVLPLPEVKSRNLPPASPVAINATAAPERLAYAVQLGTFSNLENAFISQSFWKYKGYDAYVSETSDAEGRKWYALRTGVFAQRNPAANLAQILRKKEDAAAVLVPIMVGAQGLPVTIPAPARGREQTPLPVLPEPPEKASAVQSASLAAKPPVYAVQLGAFSGMENAAVALGFWKDKGYQVYASEIRDAENRVWYAVRTGAFYQRQNAATLAVSLGRKENAPTVVVRVAADANGRPLTVKIEARLPEKNPLAVASVVQAASPVAIPSAKLVLPARAARQGQAAFSVQLGLFPSLESAAKAFELWQGKGYGVFVCETRNASGQVFYALRAGGFALQESAQVLVKEFERKEKTLAVLVPALLDSAGQLVRIDLARLRGKP